LNLSIHDSVLLFEKQTRHVDLTVLQNGTFYPKYKSLRSDAVRAVRKAKILESINTSEALDIYQQAFNKYSELELLMDTTAPDILCLSQFYNPKLVIRVFFVQKVRL
jgi:hypothetical protein